MIFPPLPTIGLKARRYANAHRRARGQEPAPSFGAGVKRMARYLRRANIKPVRVKSPRAPTAISIRRPAAAREWLKSELPV